MRTVIAGSRELYNQAYLDAALQGCPWTHEITSVLCGGATGIDHCGDLWARRLLLPIHYYIVTREGKFDYSKLVDLHIFDENASEDLQAERRYSNLTICSDWEYNGNAAGPMRNQHMAKDADALIAVALKGKRKGTDSMIRAAIARNLRIYVREVNLDGLGTIAAREEHGVDRRPVRTSLS